MNRDIDFIPLFDLKQQQDFFKRLLRPTNLLDNPGSGDCLFYSIINNIDKPNLNNLKINELRLMISIELRNLELSRENRLYKYIEGIKNYKEYCDWISHSGNWINGNDYSNFELVLSVISQKYNIDIIVLIKFNKKNRTDNLIHSYLYKSKTKNSNKQNRIILYYNENKQHYQTVIRDRFTNTIPVENFHEKVK